MEQTGTVRLPTEVIFHLFANNLDPDQITTASAVCRDWAEVASDNAIWRRKWRQLMPASDAPLKNSKKELLTRWRSVYGGRAASEGRALRVEPSFPFLLDRNSSGWTLTMGRWALYQIKLLRNTAITCFQSAANQEGEVFILLTSRVDRSDQEALRILTLITWHPSTKVPLLEGMEGDSV